MAYRNYKFNFYDSTYLTPNAGRPEKTLGERFAEILHLKENGPYYKQMGPFTYEVRNIVETAYGYKGVIGKHRNIDLPPAAAIGGDERELELEEGENILEKSHFTFYPNMNVLVLQNNIMCIGNAKLGELLAEPGYTCSLNPVINPADIRKLAQGNMMLKHAKLRIAKPRNPELLEGIEHDFNNTIFQMLAHSNTASLNLELRGNSRSKNPGEKYLDSRIKRALSEVVNTFDVSKCEAILEETDTGINHPIDLVADRVVADKRIEIEGRNASSFSIFSAMEEAKEERNDDLERYMGRDGQELIN